VHRGVWFGVIAFGVVVSLSGFVYALALGRSLGAALAVLGLLGGALVLYPLAHVGRGPAKRGDPRETASVALLVFALLTAASAVLVGTVGGRPWWPHAAGLLAVAFACAGAGALLRRRPDTPAETMRWHDQ